MEPGENHVFLMECERAETGHRWSQHLVISPDSDSLDYDDMWRIALTAAIEQSNIHEALLRGLTYLGYGIDIRLKK